MRKKYQKDLNRKIRDLNKNIENDELWNGRFIFHIMATEFERFDDGSGGMLYAIIRGYDKHTGYYKDYRLEYAPYIDKHCGWSIWKIGNKFITEDTDTYKNGHNPYQEDKIDYTKIKIDDNIWKFKYYPYKQF